VYGSIKTATCEQIVIKILKPLKKNITCDIKILRPLNDGVKIIKLIDVVRDTMAMTPAIIMEFVNMIDVDFRTLYKNFNHFEVGSKFLNSSVPSTVATPRASPTVILSPKK
jgi:hypothetical protein